MRFWGSHRSWVQPGQPTVLSLAFIMGPLLSILASSQGHLLWEPGKFYFRAPPLLV